MNLYSLPNYFVSIYTLSLGVFVLACNHKDRKNQIFFLLALATFIWLFFYGLSYSIEDYSKALITLKIGHLSAVCLTPIVYFFMLEILGRYKKKIDILLGYLSLLLAALCFIFINVDSIYLKKLVRHYWGYYPIGGPLMIAYAMFTFTIAFRAVYLFWDAAKKAKKELDYDSYQRFKYYSLSLSIFVPASVDYLPKFGPEIYPFGYVFVVAFSSLVTYAIVRHKLLDVDIVIRRSFVYSLLISIITFIYLSIILISEFIFRSYFGYQSILIAIIASSIIAITFNPLRFRLQKIIDKYFFKIDADKLIKENFQMKQELQHQDRLKAVATLAAGMAHEIKNPLTSIKTFAEYLPTKYDDPEFRSKFSRIVSDEVDRVNNIVKQLLEFSKPEELVLKPCSIVAVLDETLGFLSNNLLANKIEVTKNYGGNPVLNLDKNQMKQAFLNIFLNSIQVMPSGGTLTVNIGRPVGAIHESPLHGSRNHVRNDEVIISISDTGPGIPKEHLAHIFDPFFTTKESGTGLGLSIVHGIITKHGGKIEAKSSNGTGATFHIYLNKK